MSVQSQRTDRDEPSAKVVLATLIPRWTGGHYGYLYDVALDGDLIVSGSRDPGHDACRVLFGHGKVGTLTLVGPDGKPRMSFDILRSAFLSISEENMKGLRVRRHREHPAMGEDGERGPEEPQAGTDVAPDTKAAHARAVRHWERDDDYPHVILTISADWRIIGWRDDLQWILQRRSGAAWKSSGHVRSREGLDLLLRRNGLAPSLVRDFPEMYRGGERR